MLSNLQGASAVTLLAAGEAADTAAATGTAVDISAYEGPIAIVQSVTSVGTNIAGAVETGDASNGSDAAAVATFTTATEAGTQITVVDANKCGKYLRYKGTITGAACTLGVVMIGKQKYV